MIRINSSLIPTLRMEYFHSDHNKILISTRISTKMRAKKPVTGDKRRILLSAI
jgi:hypothetical protein